MLFVWQWFCFSCAVHVRTGTALPAPLYPAASPRQQYHLHTGESLDVTYRAGNEYVPSSLAILNHLLRDHWTGEMQQFDPREFDVLYALMEKLHRPNGLIDIVRGY